MTLLVFLCLLNLWMTNEGRVLDPGKTAFQNVTIAKGSHVVQNRKSDNVSLAAVSGTSPIGRTNSNGSKYGIELNITVAVIPDKVLPLEVRPLVAVFIAPIRSPETGSTSKKQCKSSEVYDSKTDKCRKTMSEPTLRAMITKPMILSAVVRILLPQPELRKNHMKSAFNCADPQVYHQDEHTMSRENRSAVIIKMIGEVLGPKEYYTNGTSANDSRVLFVCRQHRTTNCSGVWNFVEEGELTVLRNKSISASGRLYHQSHYIWQNRSVFVCEHVYTTANCTGLWTLIVKGEFTVLKNNSVFMNSSRKRYDWPEYTWHNSSLYVCENVSQRYATIANCTGTWVLMEEGEFTVHDNKSIYVNDSRSLYHRSEYIWQNSSLYVCENFPEIVNVKTLSVEDDDALTILTIVCMLISIIALVFVLVTYSLFSELRTPPGINLMNLSTSILLTQVLWLLGSGQTDKPIACTAIAVLLHYFFLVSFVWTSIIAFDTWRAFTAKGRRSLADSKRKRLMHCLRYVAVGWLSVMVYVAICVAIDQSGVVTIGYGSRDGCLIADNDAKWYFFATPLALIIIFNITFYAMTVKAIRDTHKQTQRIADQSGKKREFGVYVKIGSLMGFTWIFGFATRFGWLFVAYIFVVLNSLQGVYIAFAFALSGRARKLYSELVQAKRCSIKHKQADEEDEERKQELAVSVQTAGKKVVIITESLNKESVV